MFKVEVTDIKDIKPHPDPETVSLEIAIVFGWQVIVRKGTYQIGEKVVYLPVDSVLNPELENKIFGENSKITLKGSRIRAIKIRKFISQGMILPLSDLGLSDKLPLGKDVGDLIGVSKYEPPENPALSVEQVGKNGKVKKVKKHNNPLFGEYGGLTKLNFVPHAFKPDDEFITIHEKIHGSNSRCGWLPVKLTFFGKIKRFFGFGKDFEFCYGSNRVQLQSQTFNGFYKQNVYQRAFDMYGLKEALPEGFILYYEIFGPTIQKGYHYGLKNDEIDIVVFDAIKVEKDGSKSWLNDFELRKFVADLNLKTKKVLRLSPVLYRGIFQSLEHVESYAVGNSVFEPSQKIREGVVVRNSIDYEYNRKAYKVISKEYLMKENSDFH